MALHELLRSANAALKGQVSQVPWRHLLRKVVEATGSRAARLEGLDEVVEWPSQGEERVDPSGTKWTEVRFSDGSTDWVLGLLEPKRHDPVSLDAAQLVLRAWAVSARLKQSRFDERFRLWELEAVRAIATTIGGLDDPEALAEELVAHLVAVLGVKSAQVFLDQSDSPVGSFGPNVLSADDIEAARHEARCSDDVLAVPLTSDGGPLGVLVVARKEARAGTEPFSVQDRSLLELFALQVTVALEYARLTRESLERDRLQREIEVAATIQTHLLPHQCPEFRAFRLHAESNPTRQVAGDTHDILGHGGDLVVTVTDVSGKGVGAGLIASGVQAGVRMLVPEDFRLEDLASRLNGFLCGATEDNRFATFAMIRVDKQGRLFAVNAGHCPVLLRRGDAVEMMMASGPPLGILSSASYKAERYRLQQGDMVVLYTDGLTEAENAEEEEFGLDQLVDVVRELDPDDGPQGATEAIFRAVNAYTEGRPLSDDATLVVLQYVG